MPSYDYKIAKEALTETEKERLLCLFLTCDTKAVNGIINWDKATAALGNPSVQSLRVMVRTTLKKVADKGGLIDDDGSSSTPKGSSATPKKRKTAKHIDGGSSGEEGEEDTKTPTKKPRGRKPKPVIAISDEKEEIKQESSDIKQEVVDVED